MEQPKQRSTYDALMDVLSPFPSEAEAAPWEQTAKLLRKLSKGLRTGEAAQRMHPAALAEMAELAGRKPSKSRYALERLTEEFPSVREAGLYDANEWNPYTQAPMGGKVHGSHWKPSRDAKYSIDEWVKGNPEYDTFFPGSIYVSAGERGPGSTRGTPWGSYGHEASHALTGPVWEWANVPSTPEIRSPSRAAIEGFAIGSEAGLLDRFNARAIPTNYWHAYKELPNLAGVFNKAGALGAHTGEALRSGKKVSQQDIIEQILDWINQYGKR